MADHSKIEWTQTTWNFITGCTKVSAGCEHCYIERTPPFRMAGRRFTESGIGGTTGVILHEDRLTLPLHWRKPRRIFVNSLADLSGLVMILTDSFPQVRRHPAKAVRARQVLRIGGGS